jgi:hypothetical protein
MIIISLILFWFSVVFFRAYKKSRADYKHWDGIIGSDIGSKSHTNYVIQFVLGLACLTTGVMILAVALG